MATNNIRVVGYLPPSYREKLREYMKAESLTESAALVKIIKQFFDGTAVALVAEPILCDEIAELKMDVAQLQQRLTILEQAVTSGRQFSKTQRARTEILAKPQPSLPPQTIANLARRLGVSTSTTEEAYQKGEAYFRDWSRRMDPTKKSWHKRGDLFHPESP